MARAVERFTLAHELGHLVMDRGRSAVLAVTSGPWAPLAVEQRANGFAAALLMPRLLLEETVRRLERLFDEKLVCAFARRLGVSLSSLLDRLVNVQLLSREANESLWRALLES